MDGIITTISVGIGINIVVVAFGYGMLWQKVNGVCKTLDRHRHTDLESKVAVLENQAKRSGLG